MTLRSLRDDLRDDRPVRMLLRWPVSHDRLCPPLLTEADGYRPKPWRESRVLFVNSATSPTRRPALFAECLRNVSAWWLPTPRGRFGGRLFHTCSRNSRRTTTRPCCATPATTHDAKRQRSTCSLASRSTG